MTFTQKEDKKEILSTIGHFKRDIFDQSISDEQLVILADKFAQHAIFIVASDGNSEVGYVAFYCNDTENKNAFISMIIVGSEFQSKGYGRKLLEKSMKIAGQAGMQRIKLEVSRANSHALGFYDKFGFTLSSQSEASYILEKTIDEGKG